MFTFLGDNKLLIVLSRLYSRDRSWYMRSIQLQRDAAGAISGLFLVKRLVLTEAAVRCASCFPGKWDAEPSLLVVSGAPGLTRTRFGQTNESNILPRIDPFTTCRTRGHKLPLFIEWRQDRMWAETTHSVCTKKPLSVFTSPLSQALQL